MTLVAIKVLPGFLSILGENAGRGIIVEDFKTGAIPDLGRVLNFSCMEYSLEEASFNRFGRTSSLQ